MHARNRFSFGIVIAFAGLAVALVFALAAAGAALVGARPERPPSGRTILTQTEIYRNYQPASQLCAARFNSAPATTRARYENRSQGVAFSVPYNPAWGNERFSIRQYDVAGDVVYFGPLLVADVPESPGLCSWYRAYEMQSVPQRSDDAVVADIRQRNTDYLYSDIPYGPVVTTIGGHTVVEYVEGTAIGLTYAGMEVIGRKYNYRLSPSGLSGIADLEPLRNVVRSMTIY